MRIKSKTNKKQVFFSVLASLKKTDSCQLYPDPTALLKKNISYIRDYYPYFSPYYWPLVLWQQKIATVTPILKF